MRQLLTIFIIIICFNCYSQDHERWPVKVLSDKFIPDTNKSLPITVAEMHTWPRQKVGNTTPRMSTEKQVVTITGTITRMALEADGDYHIEVSDGTLSDSAMVCECVDPTLPVAAKSPFISQFKAVRAVVSKCKVGTKVNFTGVLFQDKFHSPSPKRTRNFIEIHPIIKAVITN